ncbi:MAG: type II secretion system F family protein [Nanoarchaeota archaeon]|nr:type II secretion system F family protein [Nanoarchaeota archaeon]
MIEDLKKNIAQEKNILEQISLINSKLKTSNEKEKESYFYAIKSLKSQLMILNDAVPSILESISPVKKLDSNILSKQNTDLSKISYISPSGKNLITINKKEKEAFAKELNLSESVIRGIKKTEEKEKPKVIIEKPSELARIANSLFLNISEKISPNFKSVERDLRQGNMRFPINTYTSIALYVSSLIFVCFFISFIILILLKFVGIIWILVPFALTALSLGAFYYYPSSEKDSFNKKISNEISFATIYLAAIAGSNIEPSKIFRILAVGDYYPAVGGEIRKMINQIDIYGYDLVTALKNSAERTPNQRLSELFNGIATNILSGGSLKSYLDKKSENFLLDYQLERQRYTAVAETFMDIYISLLIAAPLILIMMIIIMDVVKIDVGLSLDNILILTVGGIAFANVIFLIVLDAKQPKT